MSFIMGSYPCQVHAVYVAHTEVFGVLNTAVLQLDKCRNKLKRVCAVYKVTSSFAYKKSRIQYLASFFTTRRTPRCCSSFIAALCLV